MEKVTMKLQLNKIVFVIAENNRKNMVATIVEFAGDEIENKFDMQRLAEKDDSQLRFELKNIFTYYLNELE